MVKEIKDLTGLRVGRIVVVEYAGKGNGTRPRCKWKCKCDCGNEKIISTDALSAGITKSCGCLKSPNASQYIDKLRDRLRKHSKIEKNGCWIWSSAYLRHGYGNTTIRNVSLAAHRASWIAWKGKIPKNMYILHKCDNPSCINPEHLFLGNQKDNMQDMISKKRQKHPKGEEAGKAKLTISQVETIKSMRGKKSSYKLAPEFGIAASTIRSIWNGRNWKHLL